MGFLFQGLHLFIYGKPAEYGRYLQPLLPSDLKQLPAHLHRQLTARLQHKRAGRIFFPYGYFAEGNCKGRCFSGSRPGTRHHILTRQDKGDNLLLDCGGMVIAKHIQGLQDWQG